MRLRILQDVVRAGKRIEERLSLDAKGFDRLAKLLQGLTPGESIGFRIRGYERQIDAYTRPGRIQEGLQIVEASERGDLSL